MSETSPSGDSSLETLFAGKRGLITGITNSHSIAFHVAKMLKELGADIVVASFPNEAVRKRITKVTTQLKPLACIECDLTNDHDLDALATTVQRDIGSLDFVLHSVAFSMREELSGPFVNLSRANFDVTMASSVYSLVGLCRVLSPHLRDHAAVLTLTYLGSTLYVPNYNVMGVAKAALEASVRYLAVDLGRQGVRVNALSAGPIKTLASSGIDGFSNILQWGALNTPLRSNVSSTQVAKSAAYLLSPLSSGVSGEVHFVDAGAHAMAMPPMDSIADSLALRERLVASHHAVNSRNESTQNPEKFHPTPPL